MIEIAVALDTLRMGDFQARWDVAKQLEGCGEDVVAPLLRLLAESEADTELQWFIARILGTLASPEAILALARILEDSEEEEVRLMAAQGLAGMGLRTFAQLSAYLKDPQCQRTVVQALIQIDRPEVVPLLLEAAQRVTGEMRSQVFEALDAFRDPRIFAVLLGGLIDSSPRVRAAAIAGLAVRTQDCAAADLVEYLIPSLEDADLGVATQAARALGRLATDRGAIALAQKGCDPHLDPILHQTIIQGLGWIGSDVALEGLGKIWQTLAQQMPLPEVPLQDILSSFARITGVQERSSAVEWLLALVRSPLLQQTVPLRAKAILALGHLAEPRMLPDLVDLLADSDYGVRLHVVAALKHIDPVLAYGAIQQRIQDTDISPQLAVGLVIALEEW